MPRSPGDPAPEIGARTQDGETVSPDFAEPTVVYFYPRDDTRGCTIEATEFEAELDAYREAGVAVYGVSTDDVDSHAAFAEKHDLSFDLLADPEGAVASAFGLELREGPGDPAAPRTTFVLADGEVKRVYEAVDPEGHAEEVLTDVREADLATE
ncbi:MAG: peroxiredoxin [Haloarculaceae archaeon]